MRSFLNKATGLVSFWMSGIPSCMGMWVLDCQYPVLAFSFSTVFVKGVANCPSYLQLKLVEFSLSCLSSYCQKESQIITNLPPHPLLSYSQISLDNVSLNRGKGSMHKDCTLCLCHHPRLLSFWYICTSSLLNSSQILLLILLEPFWLIGKTS